MIIKEKEEFSERKRKKVEFWRRIERINNKRRKLQRKRKE